MKTLQVAKELSSEDLVRVVQDSEIVLMSNGHPVAFITPLHDDELYWLKRERSPEFAAAMQHALQQVASGQTYSHEEVVKMLEIDQADDASAH